MKPLGVLIMALAVLIAGVAIGFNCQHDGKAMTLANGKQVPMKCFWTALAAIASAAPLLTVGGLLACSRQRETRRSLGLLGALLGVVVIGLPTVLIGVCAHPEASCHLVMRPALIFLGALVVGLSLIPMAVPGPRREQPACP